MANMNGRTRKRLLGVLFNRDGSRCKWCGKELNDQAARIDHKDRDSANNNLDNLQILCHQCNILKDPRRAGRFNPKRKQGIENVGERRRISAELERSKEAEPKFRRFLLQHIKNHGFISIDDAVYGGAEYAGCSTETSKKYLKKCTSVAGMFEWHDDIEIIQLRAEYEKEVTGK